MGLFKWLTGERGKRSDASDAGQGDETGDAVAFKMYEGGNGNSKTEAVVINARSSRIGIPAEYAYVNNALGEENVDWKLKIQFLVSEENKNFDVLQVETNDGVEKEFWFDITNFYGKP